MYKFNSLNDSFQFSSPYKCLTLKEVVFKDINYIYQCIEEIPEFDIEETALQELSELNNKLRNQPDFRDIHTDSFVRPKDGTLEFEDSNPKEIIWTNSSIDVDALRSMLRSKFGR